MFLLPVAGTAWVGWWVLREAGGAVDGRESFLYFARPVSGGIDVVFMFAGAISAITLGVSSRGELDHLIWYDGGVGGGGGRL